jgi:hypothetical protein
MSSKEVDLTDIDAVIADVEKRGHRYILLSHGLKIGSYVMLLGLTLSAGVKIADAQDYHNSPSATEHSLISDGLLAIAGGLAAGGLSIKIESTLDRRQQILDQADGFLEDSAD